MPIRTDTVRMRQYLSIRKGRACFNHDQAFASERTYPAESEPDQRNSYNTPRHFELLSSLKFYSGRLLTGSFDRPSLLYRRASFARIPSIELGQPRRRRLITPASMPAFLLICILIELFSKILRNRRGTAVSYLPNRIVMANKNSTRVARDV